MGCVTAQATSGSRVVNPKNPGFREAGEEHWSDATLEGRAGEWKGTELEFPLKQATLKKKTWPHNFGGIEIRGSRFRTTKFPWTLA